MQWICVAVCLCVAVVQLSQALPLADNAGQETLRSIDKELGHPTAESSEREKRTVGVFRRIFPELSKEEAGGQTALSEAASEVKEVRVPFPAETNNDLQAAASGEDNDEAESSQEEISDDIDISESGENTRSKRLGVFGNLFGGGGGSAGGAGGSGGGSGNFLFDIIRNAADGAARSAGTVYRFLAGTETGLSLNGYNNNLAVPTVAVALPVPRATAPPVAATPSQPQVRSIPPVSPTTTLVAGSGQTEQQDENANAPLGAGDPAAPAPAAPAPADDGYQAGIPGPITRLFVIANRGIANLVQDLILMLENRRELVEYVFGWKPDHTG